MSKKKPDKYVWGDGEIEILVPPKKSRSKRDEVEKMPGRKGRLDWSPKENWVERAGGLPRYIEDIALALIRERGMPRGRAIAVAISRVKLWAAGGGDVNADTRAKAAKAVAQWEALKAKNRAKKG